MDVIGARSVACPRVFPWRLEAEVIGVGAETMRALVPEADTRLVLVMAPVPHLHTEGYLSEVERPRKPVSLDAALTSE